MRSSMETGTEFGCVLVTGGAGYIGGQTVLSLLDAGYQVCVLDDLSTGTLRPFLERTAFYKGRIHDQDLVTKIVREHNVHTIIHFAGSIQVAESIENPIKYYENNTEGSRCLIQAAVETGIKQFIFSSTAAVYGNVAGTGVVSEDARLLPLNPYGWSKLFTEKLLEDISAASGMRCGILRYFNVAGADPNGRHGQFLKNPVHLIGRAIDAMLGIAPALQIFGDNLATDDGTGVRDYIHVSDLADAHVALIRYLIKAKESSLFNLGYGKGHSVNQVVYCLEKIAEQPVPHEYVEARAGEAPAVIADVTKVNQELNWSPKYDDLEFMIRSALEWKTKVVLEMASQEDDGL